jgi:hypothetical protein
VCSIGSALLVAQSLASKGGLLILHKLRLGGELAVLASFRTWIWVVVEESLANKGRLVVVLWIGLHFAQG